MIIKAPIDLELTQNSGQTSQPPWKLDNNIYSDVVVALSLIHISEPTRPY